MHQDLRVTVQPRYVPSSHCRVAVSGAMQFRQEYLVTWMRQRSASMWSRASPRRWRGKPLRSVRAPGTDTFERSLRRSLSMDQHVAAPWHQWRQKYLAPQQVATSRTPKQRGDLGEQFWMSFDIPPSA